MPCYTSIFAAALGFSNAGWLGELGLLRLVGVWFKERRQSYGENEVAFFGRGDVSIP